jgi:CheY-like chemotaxis protein
LDTQQKPSSFLIVENDPSDAFLIRRALASKRCGQSFLCRNPSEAKAYLKGAGMYADRSKYPLPEVILTDLRMEDESGIELVEWIREQEPPLRDTKILILTGSASPLQFDAATKVGAQGVHRKPPTLEELEDLLGSIARQYCPSSIA